MKKAELLKKIEKKNVHGAWNNGVKQYALDFVNGHSEKEWENVTDIVSLEKILFNGARNWTEYSYGGCALIFDGDIAKRLCSLSELKKTDNGNKSPNKRETWLDVQARALRNAFWFIFSVM